MEVSHRGGAGPHDRSCAQAAGADGGRRLDDMADEDLMLSAGRGRVEAFEALVGRHEAALVRYFFRCTWDRARAEDLAQEVFVKLFTHSRGYEPTAKFTTYMYRVAHNLWVDDCRRRKHERGQVSLDAEDKEGTSLREVVSSGADGPRDSARKEEVVDAVISAVESLSEEHKAVFDLAEVEGLKYAEVAGILGIPEGTVKSRMHAAVRRLRERLGPVAPSSPGKGG